MLYGSVSQFFGGRQVVRDVRMFNVQRQNLRDFERETLRLSTVLFVFGIAAFVQISSWLVILAGFRRAVSKPADGPTRPGPVSVVVAARNAASSIQDLLDALTRQSLRYFDVVLVDDGSEDETASVIRRHIELDQRFSLVSFGDSPVGKKQALAAGIELSEHEFLVFTDADCQPDKDWLRLQSIELRSGLEVVVVGYSPYRRDGSLVNRLVRYETMATGLLTAAAIGLGRPYMAVGRNLGYSRSVFDRIAARNRGGRLLSGSDDLSVQEAARQGIAVRYLAQPGSFVVSEAPKTMAQWVRQKRRHYSASRAYSPLFQVGLLTLHASSLACWLAPVFLGWTGLFILAAKLAVQWPVVRRAIRTYAEHDLAPLWPVWDLGLLLFVTVVAPVGIFLPPRKW